MVGETVGHYRILRQLGAGGMGQVYEAENLRLGNRVALKFIHPQYVQENRYQQRFRREARVASSLDHPNICSVYDVDRTDDGRMFLAMTYCDGESLRQRIAGGPLDPAEALAIGHAVASGLAAAHARGIVHRDIKPGNIMLTQDGQVRIVDFGLALLLDATRATMTGGTPGTVAYMSPEQLRGEPLDARTDLWSLGVVLYEMVAGDLPFGAAPDVSVRTETNPAPRLRESSANVPADFVALIESCLQGKPERRIASASGLIERMEEVATHHGWRLSATHLSSATRRALRPRRRPLLLGVVAAAALAVAWFGGRHLLAPSPPARAVVLPLKNRLIPEGADLAGGLTEAVTQLAWEASLGDGGAWIIPYRYMASADVARPERAAAAFGVNRLVSGELQRAEGGYRLALELVDAATLRSLARAAVTWKAGAPQDLGGSIREAVATLLGLPEADGAAPAGSTAWLASGRAESLLRGIGDLQANDDEAPARARRRFREVLAEEPGNALARSLLALAWHRAERAGTEGAADSLAAHLARAADAESGGPWADAVTGEVLRRQGDPRAALDLLQPVAARFPRDLILGRETARSLHALQRVAEAESVLVAGTRNVPDSFVGYQMLGLFYYQIQRNDDAMRTLTRAAELAPEDGFVLNVLGALHLQAGNWSECRSWFERSFALWPSCDPCNNLGLVNFYDGNFEEAARYYRLSFQYCDETDYEAWGNLAAALYWIPDRRAESVETYRKAIELAEARLERTPEDPDLLSRIMDFRCMVGDTTEVRTLMDRLQPYLEGDNVVMFRVGTAYELLGERLVALRRLKDALRHGYPQRLLEADPALRALIQDVRWTTEREDNR